MSSQLLPDNVVFVCLLFMLLFLSNQTQEVVFLLLNYSLQYFHRVQKILVLHIFLGNRETSVGPVT